MTTTARERPRTGRPGTVELTGVPGSGKSRRTRDLARLLADRGVPVEQPQARLSPAVPPLPRLVRKAGLCAACAVTSPRTTAGVLHALAGSGGNTGPDTAGRAVQWLVADRLTARGARRGAVRLLDEGQVQALWSIGLRGDAGPVLAALDRRGRPRTADVLVVVSVPAEVALTRLAGRPSRHSRVQALDEGRALEALRDGVRRLDRLVAWWAAGGGEVVVLDGTDDDGPGLPRLADRLAR